MDENTLPAEAVTETDLWLLANLNLIGEPLTMKWTDDIRKLIRLGLIYKASQGIDTTLKVAITPAGRALLPAGGAVVLLADVDENPILMLGRKVQELQADLAAALARAEKAEGEAQRLRETLRWYADRKNYEDYWRTRMGEPDCTPDVLIDEGGRALKALAKTAAD